MVSDLKITVLRVFHPDEVFEDEYPIEKKDWMSSCYIHEKGQEYLVRDGEMPEGFCSGAWVAIYPHVRLLMMDGNMPGTKPGIALGSCNDGLRPVIFKIERMSTH
jgi:uncharacterized repeat protein (TIGR04076 family)